MAIIAELGDQRLRIEGIDFGVVNASQIVEWWMLRPQVEERMSKLAGLV